MRGVNDSLGLIAILLFLSTVTVEAQQPGQSLADLAAGLAEKRSLVESLTATLEQGRTATAERLRAISERQSDLDLQVQQETLRVSRIERDLAALSAAGDGTRRSRAEALDVLHGLLDRTRKIVQDGIPFKMKERLGEIDAIRGLSREASPDVDSLFSRLWSFLEGELRLTTESGLYTQAIETEGERKLVEVARLGMVYLFVKTPEGRYGYAAPAGDGWDYVFVTSAEDGRRIAALFDSFRRNYRSGYFELPSPAGGRKP